MGVAEGSEVTGRRCMERAGVGEREREKDYIQWSSVRVRAERKKHSLKESLLLNKNRCLRFLFFICCLN